MPRILVRAVLLVGTVHWAALLPAAAADVELARCAGIEEDAARLECFDALTRGAVRGGVPAEPPATVPGDAATDGEDGLAELVRATGGEVVEGWLYQETGDPIAGSVSLVAMRPSDPDAGEPAQILIGCVAVPRPPREAREDPVGGAHRVVTRVALGWGVYLGSDTYAEVTYAVDEGPARSISLYADGQSIVAGGETALGLVRELESAARLSVRVEPPGEPAPVGAVFDLSGFDAAVRNLRHRCGW